MADALEQQRELILTANQADRQAAEQEQLAPALLSRLKLDGPKLDGAIAGIRQLAKLPDPLAQRQLHRALDEGLVLERISVPLGVVGVIFEARPDAVMQIAALAIRSGNGAILKGGREANRSCSAILRLCSKAWPSAVHPDVLTLLTSREESLALLKLDGLVDLIIPRDPMPWCNSSRTTPASRAGTCRWHLPSLCGSAGGSGPGGESGSR